MIISGIQKTTFIDYPGKIAATIFLAGCNFRCPFCHNRNLVLNERWLQKISPEEVLGYLKKRRKYLEGICITGGEPLIYNDIVSFIATIKKLNLAVKLDTNGTNPRLLKDLYDQKLIDYVAFDIKASLEKYNEVSGVNVNALKIKDAIRTVMGQTVAYEFRSTILPRFHPQAEIEKMAQLIKGARLYYLQNFVPRNTLDQAFMNERSYTPEEMKVLSEVAGRYVEKCRVR